MRGKAHPRGSIILYHLCLEQVRSHLGMQVQFVALRSVMLCMSACSQGLMLVN